MTDTTATYTTFSTIFFLIPAGRRVGFTLAHSTRIVYVDLIYGRALKKYENGQLAVQQIGHHTI